MSSTSEETPKASAKKTAVTPNDSKKHAGVSKGKATGERKSKKPPKPRPDISPEKQAKIDYRRRQFMTNADVKRAMDLKFVGRSSGRDYFTAIHTAIMTNVIEDIVEYCYANNVSTITPEAVRYGLSSQGINVV